ncbi:type II toxin-antitoxin system RelE/ParE family toxin [Methylobacter sp. Wu8]|uniref:Plasmid stabilization system protein ParE n=1 Tax=Methylobacter tundripaludum TaxID=173365 RepID=A0A2S6H8E4_9GAMM|nr:type II toxin-antitoxin system RelE/ParE family toxin [Methylobacter tundripaludum]MCK9636621.1 type II toxin-antitoxin system RelE/ParE family toxin [Methylobacter tundripaludum]PPK73762.1 plasmid stabilization system protein ParE [Methylobacter tundripaludum]
MKIEFLESAQTELDQAFEWYEAQQKDLGVQFLNEFDAAIRRIATYPESYILIEKNVRRCLVKRFPYGILYGIDADKIIVIAVAHLHRKPDYWIDRA